MSFGFHGIKGWISCKSIKHVSLGHAVSCLISGVSVGLNWGSEPTISVGDVMVIPRLMPNGDYRCLSIISHGFRITAATIKLAAILLPLTANYYANGSSGALFVSCHVDRLFGG